MKKLFLTLFVLLFTTTVFSKTDFCSGFERGYTTGYKRSSSSILYPNTPFPPVCPSKPLKTLTGPEPQSDYEHGYVIGYDRGVIAGSK